MSNATERPSDRPIRVAVIGAGMSGILAAIKLAERKLDFVVFEKADRVGGTWRENTYPGLACDVPAHWYTYSFARNPEWSSLLAAGPEIQAYFERMARQFAVQERIRFNEEVVKLEYADGGWTVATASGRQDRFDVVITATGVLHHPNIPDFEGLSTFKGKVFHSARWDHSVALDGKRIGVVGTGSTAAQITAALAPRASKFVLFQRTAQWVMARPNATYSNEDRAKFRKEPAELEKLVQQYRSLTIDGYATAVLDYDSPQLAEIQRLCSENLATVRDPELRARLTPNYRAACKRLVISSEFYPAIQRDNAELVTSNIERIEPEGVRTKDGRLHELDVLVLATGFHTDRFVRPAKVFGRDGVDLDDAWREAPVAYLAVTVPDFPNFFMLGGPNSPIGNFSLIEVCEWQLGYVLQLIDGLSRGAYREISATGDAMERFEEERKAAALRTVWVTGCNSWYLDKQGIPSSWTFTYNRFVDEMRAPHLDDFEIR